MSIQTEIALLQNTKDEIRTAIMEKGVTVYNNDPFSIYPTRIGQISTTAGDRDALFTDILERDITSIEIPEGTSRIDEAVFRYCTQMTTVVIPSTVSFIGYLAFEHCTALTSITCLGTTPATLDGGSFNDTNNCPIYVPTDSVDTYKTAWPQYADRIQAIQVPVPALKWTSSDGTQEISIACEDLATAGTLTQTDRTNADTGNLMGTVEGSAEIGDCVTTIGLQAFYNCSSLTSVTIPDSVTNIGVYTFAGCEALTSVTIPDSVTAIESYTFTNCSSLTSVNIPSGVYSIGLQAFQGCSKLTSVTIPDSVTTIGDSAFQGCSSLTSISIPDGVTRIGGSVFVNCSSLTRVTIPDSVTSIGSGIFQGCSKLTSVTIGNGVTTIGSYVFYGLSALTSVTVNATTPPTLGSGAFKNTNCKIYVPRQSVQSYKAATKWSEYADRIQAIP